MNFINDLSHEDIASRLRFAIRCVLSKDRNLFNFEVNERTVTQRLALYLENEFASLNSKLRADCEYNRMWAESCEGEINLTKKYPKLKEQLLSIEDTNGVTVFPDIIVHLRESKLANVLVIEAKRNSPQKPMPENDRIKLFEFTRENGSFRYLWGAFLDFRSFQSPCGTALKVVTLVDIVWFRDGKPFTTEQVQLQ